MAINREKLQESFQIYDKEIVVEIIDLFFEEYPERVEALDKATSTYDSELLRDTAHGLKGVISHFHAEQARKLSQRLEEMGASESFDGAEETKKALFAELKEMVEELKEIKKAYQ